MSVSTLIDLYVYNETSEINNFESIEEDPVRNE